MPQTCSVPNCKGNYKTGPKVKVYSFPKEEPLRSKWIRAIKREGFEPTQNSKVCEQHFREEDILHEVSEYDEKSGKLVKCKLKISRVKPGVIPTILPNCPVHLSTEVFTREGPDDKKKRREFANLSKALEESARNKDAYDELYSFENLKELKEKTILKNTKIEKLEADFFDGMPKLEILMMNGNKLTTLDSNLFAPVENQLTHLLAERNPLVCDCNLLWLKNNEQNRSMKILATCKDNATMKRKEVISLDENEYCS